MRNVAFSILLVAIALLQVAVVSAELSHQDVQTAAVARAPHGKPITLASLFSELNVSL